MCLCLNIWIDSFGIAFYSQCDKIQVVCGKFCTYSSNILLTAKTTTVITDFRPFMETAKFKKVMNECDHSGIVEL